jgi:hypothetical protein
MPKVLTAYANSCGMQLSESPHKFPTIFYPTPNKYITISNGADNNNKSYDYYHDVIDLIINQLKENGFEIVQVGFESDTPLSNTIDLRGKTNFRQSCFVIQNSHLHIGNDYIWNHVAGSFQVPLIGVYGASPINSTLPYYLGDCKFFDGKPDNSRHNYGVGKKYVNNNKPEEIAKTILNNLGLKSTINIETHYIGEDYSISQVDIIPNFPVQPNIFKNMKVVLRCDIDLNLNALGQALMYYSAGIITDKPIPMNLIHSFKKNIAFIYYIIKSDYSKEFIKQIHSSGINYVLISQLEGEELANIKLDLFDYNQVHKKAPFDTNKINSDLLFKTNRLFIGVAKTESSNSNPITSYPSVYHYKNNIPFQPNQNKIGEAISSLDFLDSCESYYFFKKSLD